MTLRGEQIRDGTVAEIDLAQAVRDKLNAVGQAVRTVTVSTTLTSADCAVFVDASAGPVTITLPTAASAYVGGVSQLIRVRKSDTSGNAVTVVVSGGGTAATLYGPDTAFDFLSNGTTWGGF
jgi:hypothetical protein